MPTLIWTYELLKSEILMKREFFVDEDFKKMIIITIKSKIK